MKNGYFEGRMLTPYIKNNHIELQKSYGLDFLKNINLLFKDRIDALYSPSKISLLLAVNRDNLKNTTRIIEIPEDAVKIYTIFAKSTFNEEHDLINRYNNALKKVDGANTYKSLLFQNPLVKSNRQ